MNHGMHVDEQLLGLRDCWVRKCEELHGAVVFANARANSIGTGF